MNWTPVEVGAWIALAGAAMPVLNRALLRLHRAGDTRWLAAVVGFAAIVRLATPYSPIQWYYGGANLNVGSFTRANIFVPWVDRLIILDLGFGNAGARVLHIVLGTLAILLLVSAVRDSGRSPRTTTIWAVLLAGLPLYVRLSASNAPHMVLLCLHAAAAAAFASLWRGTGKVPELLTVIIAPALAGPIRPEAAPMLFTAGLLTWRGELPLPLGRRRLLALGALLVGAALGMLVSARWHYQLLQSRFHLEPISAVVGLVFRGLALPDPFPVSYYPALLALPVWYLIAVRIRSRDWSGLRAAAVYLVVNAAPFLFGQILIFDLAAGAYATIPLLLPLLLAAEGIDEFLTGVDRGEWLPSVRQRSIAAVAVAVAVVASFVPPLFKTWSFQEEFHFLRTALVGLHGTVLTIFDDASELPGDFDCCTALPDATLMADFPSIRWNVVDADSAQKLDSLDFDYYYQGSLISLDPTSTEGWRQKLADGDPENRAWKRRRIERLQDMDARIRELYRLEVVRKATLPGATFSFVAFPDDRMNLAIYRRVR